MKKSLFNKIRLARNFSWYFISWENKLEGEGGWEGVKGDEGGKRKEEQTSTWNPPPPHPQDLEGWWWRDEW